MLNHNEITDEELAVLKNSKSKDFALKISKNKEKASKAMRIFLTNLNTEAKETHAASKIIVKFLKDGKVNKEEENELRQQVYDLLKLVGIGVPFFFNTWLFFAHSFFSKNCK